jgi:adenylylsulfate reductase subunit A
MDEYAGGVGSAFTTSGALCEKGLELMGVLKEDAKYLGAKDLHQLMRCWENYHRMYQAESHVRSILFREETRWPGYYFRSDKPKMDNENWNCFVNCTMDPTSEEWTMKKVPVKYLFA